MAKIKRRAPYPIQPRTILQQNFRFQKTRGKKKKKRADGTSDRFLLRLDFQLKFHQFGLERKWRKEGGGG